MFDVRRLVVLREVARCGSLSAAASALMYTTSAVSQQISTLEREVGSTLLVRSPTGAQPTPAGRRLLEHAENILAAIAAAEHDLARQATASPETLRVASFASAAAAILPARSPGSATPIRGAPAVGIRRPRRRDRIAGQRRCRSGRHHRGAGERAQYPGVRTVPVYDDEFFVVLPPAHRLAGRAEVPLSAGSPTRTGWSARPPAPARIPVSFTMLVAVRVSPLR